MVKRLADSPESLVQMVKLAYLELPYQPCTDFYVANTAWNDSKNYHINSGAASCCPLAALAFSNGVDPSRIRPKQNFQDVIHDRLKSLFGIGEDYLCGFQGGINGDDISDNQTSESLAGYEDGQLIRVEILGKEAPLESFV